MDCREPADFAIGHLRGAINVGLQGRFAEWAASVLSPHRDIVLVGDPSTAVEAKVRLARVGYDRVVGHLGEPAAYCASGYRSSIAASVLQAAGLTDVSDVLGGYRAWTEAGLPRSERSGPKRSRTILTEVISPPGIRISSRTRPYG